MKKLLILLSIFVTLSAFAGCGKKEVPASSNNAAQKQEAKKEDSKNVPEFLTETNEEISKKKDKSVKYESNNTLHENNNSAKIETITEEQQKHINVAVEVVKHYLAADYTKPWSGYRLNKDLYGTLSDSMFSKAINFRDEQRKYITDNKLKRTVKNITIDKFDYFPDNGQSAKGSDSFIDMSVEIDSSIQGKYTKKFEVITDYYDNDKKYTVNRISEVKPVEGIDFTYDLYLEYNPKSSLEEVPGYNKRVDIIKKSLTDYVCEWTKFTSADGVEKMFKLYNNYYYLNNFGEEKTIESTNSLIDANCREIGKISRKINNFEIINVKLLDFKYIEVTYNIDSEVVVDGKTTLNKGTRVAIFDRYNQLENIEDK